MQGEPSLPLHITADADETSDPIELLRRLDRLLSRRASAIESELVEISRMRALIGRRLPPETDRPGTTSAAPCPMGQRWGK